MTKSLLHMLCIQKRKDQMNNQVGTASNEMLQPQNTYLQDKTDNSVDPSEPKTQEDMARTLCLQEDTILQDTKNTPQNQRVHTSLLDKLSRRPNLLENTSQEGKRSSLLELGLVG